MRDANEGGANKASGLSGLYFCVCVCVSLLVVVIIRSNGSLLQTPGIVTH